MIDLATRSFSKDVQELLVNLLNEANAQVKAAHESANGMELLAGKEVLPADDQLINPLNVEFDPSTGAQLATVVSDPMDLDPDSMHVGDTRPRTQPKRFADEMLKDPVYATYGRNKKHKTSKGTAKGKKKAKGKGKKSARKGTADSSDMMYEEEESSYQSESSADSDDDYDDYDDADTLQSDDDDSASDASVLSLQEDPDIKYDIVLESKTTKTLRKDFMKLTASQQEAFNQDEMNLRQLLSLSPDRVYTLEDLEDSDVLDRALRLLYQARFGQTRQNTRISPHINYDKLPTTVSAAIKAKLHLEEAQVQRCIDALNARTSKPM